MTKQRLEGKRALVTAAGQGIGLASVLAMAEAGATVFATDVNEGALAEIDHPNIETFALNVLDDASVKAGIEKAQPDVLFNCAGYVHNGTILEATDDDWDFAFDLNAKAQFHTIRAALPGMLERGGGSIINMSSVASSVTAPPNRFIYTASKAAVVGITKSVAMDYVTKGIRCNCICPGTVDSPSLHERLKATGDYEAALAAFNARQPMGRIARAEEIAALVVYLASDESSYTTGQAHVIDGGWSI
ncbi:SDR family oxidoreductase [Psychromarinibacter halotolerans]|uniref:SDR family oxidoreductase n=1 Tax=Psychromarinibacter halotolerans TaxID=1775175 RepID=A0ABV7GQU2_9RHOB|nr:SDR family oxidoreductase [Psychromarinibacter halotolerans]MAQ86224.1 NAD(P)-dependent oxidoreductase [Maritimibacter sp.]MDF0596624.1 SDR family oxidoreductase [Psychromarinibacter halotolerans]